MTTLSKSIIFIGFKNVGKSVIARELASVLNLSFIDLDAEIEHVFEKKHSEKYSCRQIMEAYGQIYFRDVEHRVLVQIIQSQPSIIALGGGTALDVANQELIKNHTVVYIKAARGVVFERIMLQGRPAFFSKEESALTSFNKLWNEREKIYKKLADFTIDNNDLIAKAVKQVMRNLYEN